MKVALIGASGNVGSRILKELVARKHQVTAIARNPEKIAALPGVTVKQGDLFDDSAMADLLKGHDAVISSVFFTASDPAKLVSAVKKAGIKRYLVVGGAGSLEIPSGLLVNSPDFPEAYKPEANKGLDFLIVLRREKDLDWTFLSPSAEFGPGERTGTFRLGENELLVGPDGSRISFEDFAVAMVDELEKPKHIRQRFTVGY